jgi:probable HAF family extracellular repeat protein
MTESSKGYRGSSSRSGIRRVFQVLLAFGVVQAAQAVRGAVQYAITDLGTIAGAGYSEAHGINAAGQVTGRMITTQTSPFFNAFLYDPSNGGSATDIGSSMSFDNEGDAINDLGQVAGWSQSVGTFLYRPGIGTSPVPTLSAAVPDGMNNASQIVGRIANGTTDRGFIYTPGVGTTTLGTFGTAASNRSEVTAINDNGVAAGWADLDSQHTHAFIYANGMMTDLGTLGGVQNQSQAFAINSLGHVAGESFDKLNISNAFLYTPGVGLAALGGFGVSTHVLGMNDLDQIVGYGEGIAGVPDEQRAFIYNPGGGLVALTGLIPPDSGWILEQATAINNAGQIVGYGTNPQGNTDAFLLTPLPEPASGVLLFATAGALLRRRPRGRGFETKSR